MFLHEPADHRQLVIAEPAVRRQRHRVEPKLCVASRLRHVNVRRFLILQAVKEESVAAHPEQGRHSNSLLLAHTNEEFPASFVAVQILEDLHQRRCFVAAALRNSFE